jgi:ubiquinone/menaquinone biosynthesis C-methylase UbiE
MKYFNDGMDAERYARARPNIHPTAIDKFRQFSLNTKPFSLVLDVGCGTGQSTVVLKDIAEKIIGIDCSADMIKQAIRHPAVEYLQSTAENIPFDDGQFDLITVAQAYHWFDHNTFLSESRRLLRKSGWLLVYTSWFTSNLKNEPAFSKWFNNEYMRRYPSPPRNRYLITKELAQKYGFELQGEEEFSSEVDMSIDRFTDYQLSTSNIIAAVKNGNENFDDAAGWIKSSIAKFFENRPKRTFLFRGSIWYLKKVET